MKIFWTAIICIVVTTVLAVIFLPEKKASPPPVLTDREKQEAKHDLEWMDSELKDDLKIDSLEKRYRDTIIKLRMEHMNKYFKQ